jgi:hypothetical protein
VREASASEGHNSGALFAAALLSSRASRHTVSPGRLYSKRRSSTSWLAPSRPPLRLGLACRQERSAHRTRARSRGPQPRPCPERCAAPRSAVPATSRSQVLGALQTATRERQLARRPGSPGSRCATPKSISSRRLRPLRRRMDLPLPHHRTRRRLRPKPEFLHADHTAPRTPPQFR